MPAELIPILILVAVVVLILILFGIGYVKAPPDTAYIISGLHKNPKILVGRAGVRIPFFERLDRLPLNIIPIDIKTQESVPTKEFINIRVDGVANVKISSDGDSLTRAAQFCCAADAGSAGGGSEYARDCGSDAPGRSGA